MTHKIAAIQMNSGQNIDENLKKAAILIENAVKDDAKMVVLPEMFSLIGATESQTLEIGEPLGQGKVQDFLANTAAKHSIWIVGGTTPILHPKEKKLLAACLIYNSAGLTVACYNKLHLFDVHIPNSDNIYEESKITAAGHTIVLVDTPFGRLGVGVCYDIRFPELFRILFQQGVEIIAIPAAFTAITGKAHWEVLLRARAIENFSYVVGACQSGVHSDARETYGHSMIVGPWGEVVACLKEGEGHIVSHIDRAKIAKIRESMPVLSHSRIDFASELQLQVVDEASLASRLSPLSLSHEWERDSLTSISRSEAPAFAGINLGKEARSEDVSSYEDPNPVKIVEKKSVYRGFFRIDRYLVQHRLFKGGFSNILQREVFERGSAAAALLYDPILDKLVLIEQFRIGALKDPESPWLIEVVAGVLKPQEEPQDLIIRETQEEADLEILDLHYICRYWVSPGGSTEQITLFCGRVDARKAGGIHGLPEEGEDIRSIVLSPSDAYVLLEKGQIKNAPTIIGLQWFQKNKKFLQEMWG